MSLEDYTLPCFLRFVTKIVNFRHNCKQANRLNNTSLRMLGDGNIIRVYSRY